MTKKEIIELIKRDEFKIPGYTYIEAIKYIEESPIGFSLAPLFVGEITKENIDNLVNEYPTIDITE